MPTIAKAEADYDQCVSSLNSSNIALGIVDKVNLRNEPDNASLMLRTDYFSTKNIENIVQYNTSEFQCFTTALQSIDNIDQSRVSQISSYYAAALAETHDTLRTNSDTYSIGKYNRYMTKVMVLRENLSANIAEDKINALSSQDASIKAERSRKLSEIGSALSNFDAQPNYTRSSITTSTSCHLIDNIQTGTTKQCVYSCLGKTHIVTKAFGICSISITK